MTKAYQCVTGNWLPHTKRIFWTFDECKEHIKKILDMKESWVSERQALHSVRVYIIDRRKLPQYREIFKEYPEIRLLKTDRIRDRAKKASAEPVKQKSELEGQTYRRVRKIEPKGI